MDLHVPIVVDGTDDGAPIENLKAALKVINPKAYLPIHWDGLWGSFQAGAPKYLDPALEELLSKSGVQFIRPAQYMDKWRLDRQGVRAVPNAAVKQALVF